MDAASRTVRQLSTLIQSRPVVAICLSGRKEFDEALKENSFSVVSKTLNFNHSEWSSAMLAESRVHQSEIDLSNGFHTLRAEGKHTLGASKINEADVPTLLALLLKQHKADFLLNRKNHYLVVQDTVHTGMSLRTVRQALTMNGVPNSRISTVAFRSSISPVFPPDVCGEKTLLNAPTKRSPSAWVRIGQGDKDFLVNVPL